MRMVKKACHETASGGSKGRDPGNPAPPPLFLEQTEAQRTEKVLFGDHPPPLSKGLDDRPLLISRSGSGTVKNRSHLHFQLCACITLFWYISLPSLHYSSRRENAYQRFVEDVSAGPRLSLSFPELWYSLLELNPRKNCQHLTNWKRWAKGDKVWSSAASLFEWRFRSRRRSCCLSSQLINHLHVGMSAKTVASE